MHRAVSHLTSHASFLGSHNHPNQRLVRELAERPTAHLQPHAQPPWDGASGGRALRTSSVTLHGDLMGGRGSDSG